jgi:hypothetical protein
MLLLRSTSRLEKPARNAIREVKQVHTGKDNKKLIIGKKGGEGKSFAKISKGVREFEKGASNSSYCNFALSSLHWGG